MRILLVEDHQDSAAVIARVLRKHGHDVDSVGSAAEAIERCRTASYDLLISDVGLPDVDGWELVARIRGTCVPRAIALTGYGRASEVERSRAAGFDAHLTKPVDIDTLLKTVARVAA